MAKPILLIKIPEIPGRVVEKRERLKEIVEGVSKQVDNEYHVLCLYHNDIYKPEIECFNDCKGLPDIDIEKLITWQRQNNSLRRKRKPLKAD